MATPENTDTATTSRQARRRRIVERGSDRFALITGRIQSLSPSTDSDYSPSATYSPSISQDHRQHPFNPSSLDTVDREDEVFTPLSHNDPISEISMESVGPGPLIPERETGIEASEVPLLNSDIQEQQSQLSSTLLDTRDTTPATPEHHAEPIIRRFEFCTMKEISSAVTSTEWTRICCSLAAAIIVVFSYVGLPILGSYVIKSVILFRPLYLLIVTNISIVAQHILSEKQRRSARVVQRENDIASGSRLNNLGDALEIGFLLERVMGSLFMDCSIFSVVVVCGVSIAQTLGW